MEKLLKHDITYLIGKEKHFYALAFAKANGIKLQPFEIVQIASEQNVSILLYETVKILLNRSILT